MSEKNNTPSLKKLTLSTSRFLSSCQVITSVHSVVKELVENSLDATATSIDVKLIDCGLSKVEIRDNGIGVCPVDVLLMAKPHYTSKLSNEDDIGNCSTYGFRGEALSALCAVADVSVTTKTAQIDVSVTYTFDSSGNVINQRPSPLGQGTTVCCQNLLKNLPVRKKIWNSAKHKRDDLKKCEDLIKMFSVIHSEVRFSLNNENCLVWQKGSVSNVRASLVQAWGISVLQQMEEHTLTDHRAEIELLAFLPQRSANWQTISKKSADACWIAVNKKPVKQRDIIKLLNSSFGNYWGSQVKGRYPLCFLHFTLAPEKVDVNLEPNKDKVFFHCKESVLDLVSRLVEKAYKCDQENEDNQRISNNNLQLNDHSFKINGSNPTDNGVTLDGSSEEFGNLKETSVTINVNNDVVQENICKSPVETCSLDLTDRQNISSESVPDLSENECLSLFESLDDEDDDFIKNSDYSILSKQSTKNGEYHDNAINNSTSNVVNDELRFNSNSDVVGNVHKYSTTESAKSRGRDQSTDLFADSSPSNTKSSNDSENCDTVHKAPFPSEESNVSTNNQANKSCHFAINNDQISSNNKNDNRPINNNNEENQFKSPIALKSNAQCLLEKQPVESLPKQPTEKWTLGQLANQTGDKIEPVKLIAGGGGRLAEKRRSSLVNKSPTNHAKKLKVDRGQTKLDDLIASQTVKKPKSPFSFFCKENRAKVVEENPNRGLSQITNVLVEMFEKLDPAKKEEYKMMAEKNTSCKAPSGKGTETERQSKGSKVTGDKPKLNQKEISLYFNLKTLKDFPRKPINCEKTSKIKLVGQLEESGSWIGYMDGNKLVAMNHFRMKEALIYQKLKSSFELKAQSVLTPTVLDERSFGSKELFQVLLGLPAEKINFTSHLYITDRRITANGFKIIKSSDGDKAEITDCNQDLPYYGLNDLKEILQSIHSGYKDLALCRPRNVQHFLQGETVRMIRQMPSKLTESEMESLLESCLALPENCRICAHNKPFLHVIEHINVA